MKIICIGRNYIDHIKELSNQKPMNPVVFLKPDSAVIAKNQNFIIPSFSNEIHHEVELVIKINKVGKHIDKSFSHKYYDETGLGIDFTARDIQNNLKEKGHPVCLVGDVVGTGSSRKSATNSVLWHMGDDIPFIPNKRTGGICIGTKIAPIFFNTMEDLSLIHISEPTRLLSI